ncbi:hypothetical protein J2128_001150 [Methanomicrobium sp. W14]|jgi:hypothetical protein|uniref:PDGLE domain-containing protein n=1 Tax=Methanomicrobium sp. W14 TaxID=2817839 RepID=UPI001AE43BE3|nr:PDGLE domain-containing protein [Methanomicrobium sp. W14]MBP2133229.1 hypothetical protein [Methanomicrobium sp. W14]
MEFSRTFKVLFVCLIVLVIIVPIGLIATGTAYGEWGSDELEEMVGYIPSGFAQIADVWSAPLPDYDFSGGDHETLATQAPGYYISAIIGVILTFGILFIAGRAMAKGRD